MNKLTFDGWYTVKTSVGNVEINLIIENSLGDKVAEIPQGNFNTLEEALEFLLPLKNAGALIVHLKD